MNHTACASPLAEKTASRPRQLSGLQRRGEYFRHGRHAVRRWRQAAHDRKVLQGLSDHLLQDIGLTRAAVERYTKRSFRTLLDNEQRGLPTTGSDKNPV
jgi:uncharacterized protein YjiS (DUF1127 family)